LDLSSASLLVDVRGENLDFSSASLLVDAVVVAASSLQVAKERLDSLFYLLFVDLPSEQRRHLVSIHRASEDLGVQGVERPPTILVRFPGGVGLHDVAAIHCGGIRVQVGQRSSLIQLYIRTG
jgi:hypothetical protein